MPQDPVPGLLSHSTELLEKQFAALPAFEFATDQEAIARVLEDVAQRMGDNYPYFHPLYAGQMLKPPHPVARAAYALAMNINPNNHARDGGRASSEMEIEAVQQIAGIFGWTQFLGHLTSSGTIANLEALWVAGQLAPGKRIVGSEQAHYTHQRISAVLKLDYAPIAAGNRGRMNVEALEAELRKGDVGTVVVTLGTTALGAVDSLDQILALQERYGFRIHADAAYGGYFRLISLAEPARRAFDAIEQADSIVIDPHKHGLQPYGCGCVLFRDPAVGRFYKHDSPYTYFTSKQLHLGEISLECSRAGAAAVALWATQRLLPLVPGGEFARGLASSRAAALELDRRLRQDKARRFLPLAAGAPELDIVVWKVNSENPARASELAHRIFSACTARDLHLALVQLPPAWFESTAEFEQQSCASKEAGLVTCLRSVLMKPEHEAWLDRIWERLTASCAEVMGD
ncbi:MAG: pyridoxal phosphate-dependent decarboxylase family protein [Terracidiphilus sp.]